MIEGTLEKEGFYLYEMNSLIDYTKPFSKVFPSNASLITDANSNKYLQGGQTTNEFLFFSKLPIEIMFSKPTIFGNTPTLNTRMKINRPFTVMSDGWLNDPLAFEVVGLWSNERISNMLPREYGPEILNNPSVETPSKPVYPRVYVHTNKTDYAVGERIWMSAYLTESENHVPIQEIRPLYTQLYSPTGEMVADEILLTSTGKAVGHIQLSDSLFSGIYRLKAFTREMLNIPPIIFEKQIIIQNPIDKSKVALKVANTINSIEPPALKINLTTDKTIYQPREMVQLKIDVKSLEELPRSGTFSVSVVDLNRILFDKEVVDINTSLTSQVSDIQPITNLYIKENHLSIRGTVRNQRTSKKLSNHRVVAMLVDSTTTQTKIFESDKSGNFFIDNIDFEGSKTFTYEVLNKKNKIDPEAVVLLNDFPPRLKLPMLLADQNQLSEEQQQNIYYLSTHPDGLSTNFKTLLLQHNNQNLKPKTDSIPSGMPRIYSKPDYSITFKENSPRYMNVFEMLQGTLPGVRVFGNMIDGFHILIRGVGTWNNNDPLVLLDGMQIEIAALGGFVNPNDVERIDLLSPGPTASIYGVRGANGVIAIYSKRTKKRSETDPSIKSYAIKGYQREEGFLVPTATNPMPDFRTTIYWNPEVLTNENGEASISFPAADTPTTYRIIIEGITTNGQIGRKETRIDVRK